jgi:hypothetical protein
VHWRHCSRLSGSCPTKWHKALAEKGVKYTPRYTDLFNGQSLSPAFLAINPRGTVPVLVVEGGPGGRQTLTESRCARAGAGAVALCVQVTARHVRRVPCDVCVPLLVLSRMLLSPWSSLLTGRSWSTSERVSGSMTDNTITLRSYENTAARKHTCIVLFKPACARRR